jgi:uncharacterized repeat protein (TIGR03803 family)
MSFKNSKISNPRVPLPCRARLSVLMLALAPAIILAMPSAAQTFTTLAVFNGANGTYPGVDTSLAQGTDGNLYGTTDGGGAGGSGTIFKLSPAGTLSTLHDFTDVDGGSPESGLLVQTTNGSFFGTTSTGGVYGDGTIFKITLGGALTTIHNFDGTDGVLPWGGLVQATSGNFYGTTVWGGANSNGTVFTITRNGVLTTLHRFSLTDGANPNSGLIQASDGNFYGTTVFGGANGYGTVFKITPGGVLTSLHSFTSTEGKNPTGGLVQAKNGKLYGTTAEGEAGYRYGTIFEISTSGAFRTLHMFGGVDGEGPDAGLIQATDGGLYGTTYGGGATNSGTIFKVTTSGILTTLYSFPPEAGVPLSRLHQATDGNFYGATTWNQTSSDTRNGTLFRLSTGLNPFVSTLPASAKIGATVLILGTDLTGATRLTFNGIAASFTVVRPSEIRTTVPAGATTGTVRVTTPQGTLVSNVTFKVNP